MISKKKRLNRATFAEIIKKSKKIEGKVFSYRLHFLKNGLKHRFSVVVSSKVSSKAVIRNKIRRQIYEILEKMTFSKGVAIVVYVKKEALGLDYMAINKEISNNLSNI